MEIFKLFGSIFVNTDAADESMKKTEKNAGNIASKLGEGIKVAAQWGGALAAAATTAGIAFGKKAVDAVDGMQRTLNELSASTGVEEMEQYESVLKSIYKNNYGDSFEDIAASMATVKQQMGDIGSDKLEEMTTNAIILRDTFGFEVNETIRSAKMLMDQFKISGEDAFNLIAQGAQNGLDKNGDLLDSINEYAVHYEQLGFTAEGFFASLENGTAAGTFSVDKLGDAMKEFGIRAKDGSDSSREALEALGYDADEMFRIFNTGGAEAATATQDLINRLAAMPAGVEQTTAGVALFGTMFEDLGLKGIQALGDIEGSIVTTKDSLEQINNIRYDSLGDMMQGVGRTLKTSILIPLGERLIPWMTETIPQKLAAIEEVAPKILAAFDTVTAGISVAIQTVKDVALPILQEAFETTSGLITTAFSTVKEKALPVMQETFDWVQTNGVPVIQSIWQNIEDGWALVQPVIESAAEKLSELTEKVIEIATEIFGIFTSKFGELEGSFLAFVEDVLQPLIETYLSNLIAKFEALVEIWETILLPVIEIVVDAFFEIMQSIYENVQPAIEKIMEKFDELASLIRQAVEEYILPVIQTFVGMVEELYEENRDKLELIGELFGAIFGAIEKRVEETITWFKEKFMPFLAKIKEFVEENLDKIKATFQKAIDFVSNIIKVFIALFKGDWEGMWQAIKDTLQSAFLFIRGVFELIGAAISGKVLAIKQSITTKFEEIKSTITEKITEAKNKVVEIFDSIASKIEEKINNAKETVKSAIDKIKEFFNFDVSLPSIKLPHFSISPSGWELGDLLKGSIPSLGIEWYAKGGVMEEPTVFGMNGNRLMVGGEAGAEAIAPIDVLQNYVAQAVASQNAGLVAVLQKILDAILSMDDNMGENLRDALENTALEVNRREFARLVKAVN